MPAVSAFLAILYTTCHCIPALAQHLLLTVDDYHAPPWTHVPKVSTAVHLQRLLLIFLLYRSSIKV